MYKETGKHLLSATVDIQRPLSQSIALSNAVALKLTYLKIPQMLKRKMKFTKNMNLKIDLLERPNGISTFRIFNGKFVREVESLKNRRQCCSVGLNKTNLRKKRLASSYNVFQNITKYLRSIRVDLRLFELNQNNTQNRYSFC